MYCILWYTSCIGHDLYGNLVCLLILLSISAGGLYTWLESESFYIFSLYVCGRLVALSHSMFLQLQETFQSLLTCAYCHSVFHLSLGCPEHMTPALRGTLRCTLISLKCKRHSMLMLLGYLMLGTPAGLALDFASDTIFHLLLPVL